MAIDPASDWGRACDSQSRCAGCGGGGTRPHFGHLRSGLERQRRHAVDHGHFSEPRRDVDKGHRTRRRQSDP
eukprot:2698713-Rhodomonas_salina.7